MTGATEEKRDVRPSGRLGGWALRDRVEARPPPPREARTSVR